MAFCLIHQLYSMNQCPYSQKHRLQAKTFRNKIFQPIQHTSLGKPARQLRKPLTKEKLCGFGASIITSQRQIMLCRHFLSLNWELSETALARSRTTELGTTKQAAHLFSTLSQSSENAGNIVHLRTHRQQLVGVGLNVDPGGQPAQRTTSHRPAEKDKGRHLRLPTVKSIVRVVHAHLYASTGCSRHVYIDELRCHA